MFLIKMVSVEGGEKDPDVTPHPYIEFFNQTRKICIIGLDSAVKHEQGGRDALILANFIGNRVSTIYAYDQDLMSG